MKFVMTFALLLVSALATFAQTSDNHKRMEFFAGYSVATVDGDINSPVSFTPIDKKSPRFSGFNGSAVYNVSRYFGIKADVSGTYNNRAEVFRSGGSSPVTRALELENSLYNFLGGVQIKDNASERKVKPFAHVLVGAGHARSKIAPNICLAVGPCPNGTLERTGPAGAFGGGVDVRLAKRIDLRLIQVDYNPVRFDRGVKNNFRFGFGLVFK